ncbi:MAG: nuclear transport factor 2 family protein [Candidatus Obscuribacterales bacterium]|nr:nuclear transport factor 2 family protein [Candidatus Obscuribacterales bacterium]
MNSQIIADRCRVIDAVNLIGLAADLRDWSRCRSQFADQVVVDYSSLMGGQAEIIDADALIERWRVFFDAMFEVTQHLITNHCVELDQSSANCISQFVAHHVCLGSDTRWTIAGIYRHKLTNRDGRWNVTSMTMTRSWEEGQRPF